MAMSAAFLVSALIQFVLGLAVAWILGPGQFGIHALGLAAGVLVQTLVFDWLRLGVTRYAGQGIARLRRSLDRAVFWLGALCVLTAVAGLIFGGEHRRILALVPMVALAAGFAEYVAAHQRARFEAGAYARLALARGALAMVLLPAAAWWFRTAEATILAYGVSILLATIFFGRTRPLTTPSPSSEATGLADIAQYSGPIVLTNLAYLAMFFALRAYIAMRFGLASAGQFSLALDIGLKLVMTLGSALDLTLLQLAIRDQRESGPTSARMRLGMNAELVILVLLIAVCGFWLVLPSLELLLVGPDFRPGFRLFFTWLMPALVLFGAIQYALHPYLQIEERTAPLAIAAIAALVLALGLLGTLPVTAAPVIVGSAAGIAMLTAVLVILPGIRPDIVHLLGSTFRIGIPVAGMIITGLALESAGLPKPAPGLASMLMTILACGLVTLALAWLVNAGNIRDIWHARGFPPLPRRDA